MPDLEPGFERLARAFRESPDGRLTPEQETYFARELEV
jgi:hypothetical protein